MLISLVVFCRPAFIFGTSWAQICERSRWTIGPRMICTWMMSVNESLCHRRKLSPQPGQQGLLPSASTTRTRWDLVTQKSQRKICSAWTSKTANMVGSGKTSVHKLHKSIKSCLHHCRVMLQIYGFFIFRL